MLALANLRKEFKNIVAVDNISFNVDEGRIFGILGPNGAGQTTILRTVLNIIRPNSGKITFNSKLKNIIIQKMFHRLVGDFDICNISILLLVPLCWNYFKRIIGRDNA